MLRLRRWRPVWLLLAVWLVATACFGTLFPYLAYRAAVSSGSARQAAALLSGMLPPALPETLVAGLPMFAGAIVLVLAALATGSGYGWETWKTVLSQGPRRLEVFGGALLVLAGLVVVVMLATLAVKVSASLVVAALAEHTVVWPPAGELVRSIAGGLLILGTYAAGGAFLGVAVRRPGVAVGLGLVWVLAVANLLRGVADIFEPLRAVTDMLPGTAAGSLAGALGAGGESVSASSAGGGTPRVFTALDGETASVVLAGYLVTFLVLLMLVVSRRDV